MRKKSEWRETLFRVSFNVAFNLVIFVATMLPLGLTWTRFFGRTKEMPRPDMPAPYDDGTIPPISCSHGHPS
jgi:hypothetical protein